MPTQRSFAGLIIAIVGAGGVLVACSDATRPTFAINPPTAHLNVGKSIQLTATGSPGAVTWSTSDATVATVTDGSVTGTGSGSATIRAMSGRSQASASITVTRAATIVLSTSKLSFAGPSANPDSQSVDVTNGGEDALTGLAVDSISYGVCENDWLAARLTQSDAPATLIVRPKTAPLWAGQHTATVSISSPAVTTGPQFVTATYFIPRPIFDPEYISLSRDLVSFAGVIGQMPPAGSTVSVLSGGEIVLTQFTIPTTIYTAGQPSNWLTVSLDGSTIRLRPNTTNLAAGTYSATIIEDEGSSVGGSPDGVGVSYTLSRPGSIALGSATATFTGQLNVAVPTQQLIAIMNGGDAPVTGLGVGTINYSADATGWLTASVSSTTSPAALVLQPNTASLPFGEYTAIVPVTSTDATIAPISLTVTYHMIVPAEDPAIVVSPAAVTFAGMSGGTTPAEQTVYVSNSGSGPLTVTGQSVRISYAYGQPANWLTVSPSGTTAPLSLNMAPNTASLAPGTYSATISIGNSPHTVSVTYVLSRPASVVFGPSTAVLDGKQCASGWSRQSISIANGGDMPLTGLSVGTISYSAGASNWLYARLVASAAPSFLLLEPNFTTPVVLPVGDYTATVPVTSSVASAVPASLTVTLHITARTP